VETKAFYRWILNASTASAAVVGATVAVIALRSVFVFDRVVWDTRTRLDVASSRGILSASYWDGARPLHSAQLVHVTERAGPIWPRNRHWWNALGIDAGWEPITIQQDFRDPSSVWSGDVGSIEVPDWLLILVLAVFPAIRMHRRWRRGPSPTHSCPVCGYDLRASPQRCPECGTARGESAAECLGGTA
jgi:hypothetical protein